MSPIYERILVVCAIVASLWLAMQIGITYLGECRAAKSHDVYLHYMELEARLSDAQRELYQLKAAKLQNQPTDGND